MSRRAKPMISYRKLLAGLAAALLSALPAAAQDKADDKAGSGVFIPALVDPQPRAARPDPTALTAIRFLTEDDYPPFHFALADGQLAGFNVDIARAICQELQVSCTIQRRQWDLLAPALAERQADAVIASLAITPQARQTFDFSQPYYATPARFVTLKASPLADATPESLAGKTVGVVAGSAHAAYLERYFAATKREAFDSVANLRAALKQGRLDAAFGDGVGFAVWLNSPEGMECCAFKGGPYSESRYFGEGVGIAVRRGDANLRRALDYALARLVQRGIYGDLYLKWFPIGFY